ncbi:MAG TPA: TonB-dependent receptor [Lacunisphaera sp.]|nr:TonB-dependent receptor [Lacunisphaera sp.]
MNVPNRPVGSHRRAGIAGLATARSLAARLGGLTLAVVLAAATTLTAQNAGTGSITGRIFNPATSEYIRNAEVNVAGTNLTVQTEGDGFYHLFNVPAGEVTLTVTYPGYNSASEKLSVTAGATAVRNFELTALGTPNAPGEKVLQLEKVVVSSTREGQSKMIAEQKRAMNVKQVVSADNFGNMTEQNIGEFLKYLPGVAIDYVETDTRTAGMGGMDPKYGYVTLDGNPQASGDSGAFGGNTRQFEFESISMNNIESIEVNKTLTADMWADAPAGTVNLRTRSALDRKGSRTGFTTGFVFNSLENGFKKTPRHDDDQHAKTRPMFAFDYSSGAILDGKFGFTVNGSFTNIYKEQFRHSLSYDYTSAQAIAAGTPLVTAVNYKDGPKLVEKSGGGFKVDYQPVPAVRMTLASSFTYFDDFFANRNLNFVTTSANLAAGSSLTKVIANNSNNANTRVDQSGESTGKLKDNTNHSFVVNYKTGPWVADLSLLYSRARERRGGLYYGTIGNTPVRLSRIGFTAERPGLDSAEWTITQTGGADWYNWASWGVFDAQDLNSNAQYGKTEQYTGKIDVRRVMNWEVPTTLQAGLARNVTFKHRWVSESVVARYIGPTGNALTSPLPLSQASFLIDKGFGGGIGPLPVVNKEALYTYWRTQPSLFSQSEGNLASQLNNVLASPQSNQEDVQAGYVMAQSRLGKWQVVGGVRLENTHTRSTVPGEVPIKDNPYATFNSTTGVYTAAGTRNFVNYRFSKGLETTFGDYHDVMPSIAVKYTLRDNLFLKAGYNKAIKRPDLNRTAGAWSIDVDSALGDLVVTVPNPGLKPERSERFSLMTEYYFEPAGSLTLHVFQSNITNAIDENAEGLSADEAGFGGDPALASYRFKTFTNLDEERTVRGIELSYSQQLRFLPNELLRGLTVFATYSHFAATPRPRTGTRFVPTIATGGVKWSYRRFYADVNGTWTDKTFTGGNTVTSAAAVGKAGEDEFFKPRLILFTSASYRLTSGLSLFVAGDRAYDSGKIWYYRSDGRIRQVENYGSQWSFGVKGEY